MDGTAAARELSTRFARAGREDDAAIRRLLRDRPMRGAVSVGLEREPEYFRGADIAGGVDETIVAYDDANLVCMGRCTRRECWVNGGAQSVGYLAELRLDAGARGRFRILRDGYEFFHRRQREKPADLYFTSIAADNDRARRLLEKGARGLPAYSFLAELDTLLIAVPRNPRRTNLHVEGATPARVPELLSLLNAHGRRHQLAAVWTQERLRALEQHGLPLERFLLVFDKGTLVGCGALWDQRGFRQTVIRGYARPLTVAQPIINFASRILGTPRLPRAGSVLAHAFLSPLACTEGAEAMLPDFMTAFLPLAARCGAEYLTVARPASDPRRSALQRHFTTRTWRSRLYRVSWPGETGPAAGGTFLPDVALL